MNTAKGNDVIEVVRYSHDIVEVVGRHLQLNSRKQAKCPFHQENTPSFSVNSDGQYFHCFGCGVGGDVIRFLELIEKKPFKQVLQELATEAGIDLPTVDPSACERHDTEQLVRRILTLTARYYHNKLTAGARTYLLNRCFTDDTISMFQIGFASGGLREYLLDEVRIPLGLAVRAGVLRESDGKVRDYFYKRIIFPNSVRGQVVHLTGRSLDDQQVKYLHLSGKIEHLFNESDAGSPEVIICEGVPDCLSAIQAGYKAVGVYGTSQFNEEHVDLFSRAKTVYVCMDGDDAGRKAADRIGTLLADKAVIVALPDGQDVNSFLTSCSSEEFRHLLHDGKSFLDMRLSVIKNLPGYAQQPALEELLPSLAALSDFQCRAYSDRIAKEFKLSKKTIDSGIRRARTTDGVPEPAVPEAKPAASEAETAAAVQLLKDPDLIGKINSALEAMGCVGEENNKILTYLAMTSRLSDKPISLIVKGDSSGGKSYLVQTVSQLFPEESRMAFTTLTPKALYHRKDSLAHKILIVYERPGAEDSDYSIRSLQSEHELIISMSVKNPDTQQWETVDHRVEGPIAYIETTTKSHLHAENETRCFEIFIDDSEEQTKRIQVVQRRSYSEYPMADAVNLAPFVTAQTLLEALPVIIPFVSHIVFPQRPLRVRRDFQRFLTLIESSTILHQYQRERRTVQGREFIVANVDDYAVAYALASVVLQASIKQLSPKAEDLAKTIHALTSQVGWAEFTIRRLRDELHWDMKTVKKYLEELTDQGLVEVKSASRGTATNYAFVRLPEAFDNLLLSPASLREMLSDGAAAGQGKPEENRIGEVNSNRNNDINVVIQPQHGL